MKQSFGVVFAVLCAAVAAITITAQVRKTDEQTYVGTETAIVQELKDRGMFAPFQDGAQIEHRLWDGTRVDALTPTHAWEADWASKWAESIGQALYYAEVTGRKPGIILLVSGTTRDNKYVYRCQTVSNKHGIEVWLVKASRSP